VRLLLEDEPPPEEVFDALLFEPLEELLLDPELLLEPPEELFDPELFDLLEELVELLLELELVLPDFVLDSAT